MRRLGILLTLAMVASLILGTFGCSNDEGSNGEETVTLKLGHENTDTSATGMNALKFKEMVEERSGGTILVEVYAQATLIPAANAVEALTLGTLDIAAYNSYYWQKTIPAFAVTSLDGFWEDYDHINRVLSSDEFNDYIAPLVEDKTQAKHLGTLPGTVASMRFTNAHPLRDLTDAKGLKYPIATGATITPMVKYAGYEVVTLPGEEHVTAFQTGLVQVITWGLSRCVGAKVYDWANYGLVSMGQSLPCEWAISANAWNKLSKKQQDTILDVMPDLYDWAAENQIEVEGAAIDSLKANMTEVNTVSKEEAAEAWGVIKEYDITKTIMEKSPELVELADSMRA